MIETKDLAVQLSGKTILKNVNIRARSGEVTAIVGPNGSGKTTLIRALSGDLPYTGKAILDGALFESYKPWQMAERRAVLPQTSALSFPFTVREIVNLGLTGGRSGLTASQEAYLPDQALELVDLSGFGGRYYQELSGGEQQRAQLARVLCQVWKPVLDDQPRFLLLDEPVSSLDIRHQILVMDIAKNFAAKGGGVVTILHDLNLTALYADHVVMVHDGGIDATGSVADTLTNERLLRVYECPLQVGVAPPAGQPFILPHSVF
ncbi:heme ABC transporter ATP-binding protein [Pseudochrobactrum sp. sp1633]|uniref:heme ABC transporter ATP-binding protein n=1 Tax=Pseudochrobactrum sp. sp1633 TaxID=3036706 RepID=UPI0025A56E0F|nr:heme ABC transporter ATP-binding protein [Pseudochrobactrum sp. sp1633]MDM8346706.1 heme ABC transporter ATP-binding protein [Pseudochrobactrum sp. sp1633]HWD13382.1 heme ABC transporter ATP-binding protein [Pseudochrobactrum sp.]